MYTAADAELLNEKVADQPKAEMKSMLTTVVLLFGIALLYHEVLTYLNIHQLLSKCNWQEIPSSSLAFTPSQHMLLMS